MSRLIELTDHELTKVFRFTDKIDPTVKSSQKTSENLNTLLLSCYRGNTLTTATV